MREPEVQTGRSIGVARSMVKKKEWLAGLALGAFIVALAMAFTVSPRMFGQVAAAQGSYAGKFPVFEVDPAWPHLPNNWVLGSVCLLYTSRCV